MSRRTFQSMTFLPGLHDMRCKAPRIFEIIRAKYHRDKLNGDVYIFMSKDQTKVKTGQGTGQYPGEGTEVRKRTVLGNKF